MQQRGQRRVRTAVPADGERLHVRMRRRAAPLERPQDLRPRYVMLHQPSIVTWP